MGKIELKESAFRQSYDGLIIGDKVYFAYRDERKSNPDRYGLGCSCAEHRNTTSLRRNT